MKLIGTSQINRSYFLLIGTPIVYLCQKVLSTRLVTLEHEYLTFLPLTCSFFKFFSQTLAGVFQLMLTGITCRAKRLITRPIFFKSKITTIRNTKTNLNHSFPFAAVAFMAVLCFAADIVSSYLFLNPEFIYKGSGLLMAMIVVTIPSTYFIWNNLIYRHHLLSFAILLIGLVLFAVSLGTFNLLDLWCVLTYVFLSMRILIEKWALESRNASPFLCVSFQGLIGLIITSIALALSSYMEEEFQESFEPLRQLFSQTKIALLTSGFVLMGCLIEIMFILINKAFNPNQVVFTTSISSSILMFASFFEGYSPPYLVTAIIGNVIIVFGALIYNEILIFYCFGLEFNTRKEINIRGAIELQENSLTLFNEDEEGDAIY